MTRFHLFVPGRPVPQGSKSAFISKSTGKPIVVDKDVRLPQWRAKITSAAIDKMAEYMHTMPDLYASMPFRGGIGVTIGFVLERPKFHFGSGKNVDKVKDSAPRHPATMPDIDKLMRAIFDALTDAQVWIDDGQVVWVQATKTYANAGQTPGVEIAVGQMR